MSGFTKGPWAVQGSEVWATHGIRFNLTTVGTPLIAAAPELYEALLTLERDLREHIEAGTIRCDECSTAVNQARAALSKAAGEGGVILTAVPDVPPSVAIIMVGIFLASFAAACISERYAKDCVPKEDSDERQHKPDEV